MGHCWEPQPLLRYSNQRRRRCVACRVRQVYECGSRGVLCGRYSGWYPNVGRCGRVNLLLTRERPGLYRTADGLFRVEREDDADEWRRKWVVKRAGCDKPLAFTRFRRLSDAADWLTLHGVEHADKAMEYLHEHQCRSG